MTLTVYVQRTIWANKCFSNCWCNSCPPELQGRIFLQSAFSEVPTSLWLATAPEGILYLQSSRSSACVSFALSCFSSGFVGKKQRRKGSELVGCPQLCSMSFQALLQVIKGKRQEDRALGWWVGLGVYLAVMPWGEEGWLSYCGSC